MGQKLKTCFLIYLVILLITGVIPTKEENGFLLSLKEARALIEFGNIVKPRIKDNFMRSDFYLIRWLMAKNFDVVAAVKMLDNNLRWRRENNIDTINLEDFEDIRQDYPASVDTCDKEGRPIGTLDMAHWNIRRVVISGRSSRLLRYIHMLMENVTEQVVDRQRRGMNVTQWKVIMNAEGVNMITHGCPLCIQIWLQFMYSLDNYYPGWMNEFIAIEAPMSVYSIIDILRPFLSQHTRDHMKVFGTDKRKWMQYLDSKVSRENRRELYGGYKE